MCVFTFDVNKYLSFNVCESNISNEFCNCLSTFYFAPKDNNTSL